MSLASPYPLATENQKPIPVVFAAVPETSANTSFESQRVRVIKNSLATITTSNDSRISGSPYDFVCKFSSLAQNVRRIALNTINMSNPCPANVNLGNNGITVTFLPEGITASTTVAIGNYLTGAGLVAALNAACIALGPGGLTFTYDPSDNTMQCDRTIPVVGSTFAFSATCTFIKFGLDMYGFSDPYNTTQKFNQFSGSIHYMNSRYYAVLSTQMIQYEKNKSSASDPFNNDIVLIFFAQTWVDTPFAILFAAIVNPVWRVYEPLTQISQMDFRVVDRWGRSPVLYVDPKYHPTYVLMAEAVTAT